MKVLNPDFEIPNISAILTGPSCKYIAEHLVWMLEDKWTCELCDQMMWRHYFDALYQYTGTVNHIWT